MRINILLPSLGVTGGIRVVLEIANRLQGPHDVRIYVPLIPPDARYRRASLLEKVYDAGLDAQYRLRQGTDVEWMDVSPPIDRCLSYDAVASPLLNRRVRDADVTVATSWETAYAAARLPASAGETYYFVQHYEIWPVWNDLDCWRMAEKSEDPPSLAMVDVVPDDPYLRRYKARVDGSYELPLNLVITSDWEREVMNRLGQEPVGAVPYGVDSDLFFPDGETDSPTLLALYRGSAEKGDREAIAAFERLHRERADIDYLMFGLEEGDEIPEFVEFHRDPPQSALRQLYSRADILVYPSWVEGYGMPPMEAMACRTTVVSTDVGAVRDYSPEDAVEFVPVRDVDSIVRSVETLLDDPETLAEKQERCYREIQQYTWDATAEAFEAALDS